jgi:hypothetical protein
MRLVVAARPRTVKTAGLKVGEWDESGRRQKAPLGHGLEIDFVEYIDRVMVEVSTEEQFILRRVLDVSTGRDAAVAETLAEWQHEHPTVTIDPTDDAVDDLRERATEVAEALAAEVDRLRAELEEARATAREGMKLVDGGAR